MLLDSAYAIEESDESTSPLSVAPLSKQKSQFPRLLA